MRQKSFFISTILVTLIMGFNSCTLFIDDDELFNTNSEPLPKYQGKGYDEPVTGKGEYVDVTYQLYESTMTIQPEDELTNYIHRVDTMGYVMNIIAPNATMTPTFMYHRQNLGDRLFILDMNPLNRWVFHMMTGKFNSTP